MSCLDSLTYITLGDIASDFSLHLMSPKLLFQVLIHLRSSGVDRIKSIMSFLQNNFFQLRICWYTKASFVPQNSFFVFGESRYLACTDTTLESVDTSISFLCLLDMADQSGLKFYLSKNPSLTNSIRKSSMSLCRLGCSFKIMEFKRHGNLLRASATTLALPG